MNEQEHARLHEMGIAHDDHGPLMDEAEHARLHEMGIAHDDHGPLMDEAEHARLHEMGIAHDDHGPIQLDENGGYFAHGHYHANTKSVLNRLSRSIGHLQKVKDMVERGEDCSEVLVQLSAVMGALKSTGKVILNDHLDHCIIHAVECGDTDALDNFKRALEQYMK